jgi:hypothetical protein
MKPIISTFFCNILICSALLNKNLPSAITKFVFLILLFVTGIGFNSAWAQDPPIKSWDKSFGGSGDEWNTLTIQTSDGGYLLSGSSQSGMGGDKTQTNRGNWDYWVVKTTNTGIKQWDKRFGGDKGDILTSVTQTRDGGYLLAGHSSSGRTGDKSQPNLGQNDYWVVKINSSGNKLWDRSYGGSGFDWLYGVIPISDGFLLIGTSDSPISLDKHEAPRGGGDYWVIRISSTGGKLWDRTYGSPGAERMESFNSSIRTSDGGFLIGGSSGGQIGGEKTQSNRGALDYWIVKITRTGTKQWDRTYGGSRQDFLNSVLQSTDGGYLLSGHSNSNMSGEKSQNMRDNFLYDYWVVRISPSGGKNWDKTLGGNAADINPVGVQTSDGGFLIAGSSYSGATGDKTKINRGALDFWLVQLSTAGRFQWDRVFGGTANDGLTNVLKTRDGTETPVNGYLFAGESYSGIGGDKSQSSRGGRDYWILGATYRTVMAGTANVTRSTNLMP